jgi:hypothetical protein
MQMQLSCRLTLLTLALALLAASATAGACDKYCFRGSMQGPLTYDFAVVPCTPAKVLDGAQVAIGGVPVSLDGMTPVFSCQSDGQLVSLKLQWSVSRRFVWNYQSEEPCSAVLANLNTIAGVYMGSDHQFGAIAVLDDSELSVYQIMCAGLGSGAACASEQYSSGVVQLQGVAGDKSPCGLAGTVACSMVVQFTTPTSGACTAPLNAVSALDVVVRPNNVPLSSYQPSALLGAVLSCENSRVTLAAAGVTIAWPAPASDNSASCAVLMANLGQLAVSEASSITIALSAGEVWTASGAAVGASLAAPAQGVDVAPVVNGNSGANSNDEGDDGDDGDDDGGDDEPADEPTIEDFVPDTTGSIKHPITPTIYCNVHLPRLNYTLARGRCCAIFGFINPNPVDVQIELSFQRNWIVGGPSAAVDNPVPEFFAANTTEAAAFGWIWDCETYKTKRATWWLRTFTNDNSTRVFQRHATAVNQMDDCGSIPLNNTIYELCFPPPPVGFPDGRRRAQ